MYIPAMSDKFNVIDIFRWMKYKLDFKKLHPNFFNPCGTAIFCGPQGSGKTLSGVNYVYNVLHDFPAAILVTNVAMSDYPYNARYSVDAAGVSHLFSLDTGDEITSDSILSGEYQKVCIEYDGLDTLKFVNNGEYGVLYFIDELHLELNSLESKNIDVDVMVELSQQRKQRKHIVGTSQVFMRLAKPLREQIKDIVLCKSYFGFLQWNKLIDGESCKEEGGKLQCDVRGRAFYVHSPLMYDRYDTYAKMRRYNKEWQGHKRDQRVYDRSEDRQVIVV